MTLDWSVLKIDVSAEIERIANQLRESTVKLLRRRGAVVAISGGIDSAVCAALAVRAFGPERVLALILPEYESAPESEARARSLADSLGIKPLVEDIGPTLSAIGCYRWRDEAVNRVIPEYNSHWRMKIVVAGGIDGRFNHFRLITQSPDGAIHDVTLGLRDYLQIIAATSYKQRIRKTIEYFHADRLNYAVVGTPNKLEYELGFFVKNGDGSADIKPIAHLYKSQVYQIGEYLTLPDEVMSAVPTTDTYSLSQAQDEFYFAIPYRDMDLALWALTHKIAPEVLAQALSVPAQTARYLYADIQAKQRASQYLHRKAVLLGLASETIDV